MTDAIVGAPTTARAPFRYFEWEPVIASAIAAAAISFVLFAFGSAMGLLAVSPYPYRGLPASTFFILATVYAALVVASGAGGILKTATESTSTVAAGAAQGSTQNLSLSPADYGTDFLLRQGPKEADGTMRRPALWIVRLSRGSSLPA